MRALGMAAAIAVACVFAAYSNVVLGGQTLVATSNYHPFADRDSGLLRPGTTRGPAFLNWHDQGAAWWQWEPAAELFTRAFRAGRVPLWDPTIAGGVDAHVNVTQGQYFPPYLAVLLAGNGNAARDAYCLLMLAASGICVFLLFHGNALHPIACAAAAVAWMLGGSMTLNVNSIIGQSIAILPLLALAMDRLVDAPSPVRAAGVAVAVGAAVLSSFMPVVAVGLTLVAIQLAVAVATRRETPRHGAPAMLGIGVASIAAGLALSAFLLVPAFLATRADAYFTERYPGTGIQHYPLASWPGLLSRVVPFAVGQGDSPYPPPAGDLALFDVGLVPVLLALLASSRRSERARKLVVVFVCAAVYVFARLFGVPPLHWVGHLPVLREMHFVPYGTPVLALAVAGLAAVGVDGVVRHGVTRRRAAILTAVVAALAGGGGWFMATHEPSGAWMLRDPSTEAIRLALLAGFVIAIAWTSAFGRIPGVAAGALLLAAAAFELLPLARVERFQRASVWRDVPPYVRALQQDATRFRVLSADLMALTPNVPQGLGLEAVGSRHAVNPWRYSRLIRAYFPTAPTVYPLPTDVLPARRVILDLLNVKYVVLHGPPPALLARLQGAGVYVHLTDGAFAVMRNPTAWPRAYVAGRHRVVSGVDAAIAATGELTAPDTVVLEESPRVARDEGILEGAECQVREYAGERVRLQAHSPRPAILVLSDSYAEGWTATVDGRPAPILVANAAFRAVEIPEGRSEIVFRYVTPGLYAGLAVSGLTAAGLVGLAAWSGTAAQRRRSQMLPPGLRSQSGIAP